MLRLPPLRIPGKLLVFSPEKASRRRPKKLGFNASGGQEQEQQDMNTVDSPERHQRKQANSKTFPLEPHYILAAHQKVPLHLRWVFLPHLIPVRKSPTGIPGGKLNQDDLSQVCSEACSMGALYILSNCSSVLTITSKCHQNRNHLCQHP